MAPARGSSERCGTCIRQREAGRPPAPAGPVDGGRRWRRGPAQVAAVRQREPVAAGDEVQAPVLRGGVIQGDPDGAGMVGVERPPRQVDVVLRRGGILLLDQRLVEIDPHCVDTFKACHQPADGGVLHQFLDRRTDPAQVHPLGKDLRVAAGWLLGQVLRYRAVHDLAPGREIGRAEEIIDGQEAIRAIVRGLTFGQAAAHLGPRSLALVNVRHRRCPVHRRRSICVSPGSMHDPAVTALVRLPFT